MVKFFDRHVIGQEAAKKIVAVAIYNHYCRLIQKLVHPEGVCYEKSNIMLVGPSGSGKPLGCNPPDNFFNRKFC